MYGCEIGVVSIVIWGVCEHMRQVCECVSDGV